MQHEIDVERVVPNAIPGLTSIKLAWPRDDDSTHMVIPVSPYATQFMGRGLFQSSMIVVISGEFNLVEICCPPREELEEDVVLQHDVACFIGEDAVGRYLNDQPLTRLIVSDDHRKVWEMAYRVGVGNIDGWHDVFRSVSNRTLTSLK